jgi:hypothetical protein
MGSVKRAMSLSTAGSLSFTDTTNTVLQGQSMARFALIFGSSSQARALKNVYITVTANLRTTLDSVNNPFFNHTGNYVTGGTMNFHEFYFSANYSYRIGGNTVTIYGDTSNVSLSLNSNFIPLLVNGGTIPAAGTHTLYYKYFDSSIDPTGVNAKSNSVVFVIDPLPLIHTDIYAVDAVNYTSTPLYEYDVYQPILTVTPLYNDETTPRIDEPPLGSGLYSTSLPSGTMVTANTTNTVTCSHSFTSILTVSVNTTRTSTGITLSGQKTNFLTGETFSIDTMVVTGNWSAGSATTPSYASSQTDGKYTVSKAPGSALLTAGTQTITVSYYVNEANVTATYDITIARTTYTFFNHSFSYGGEWGATDTPVYGEITNRDGELFNSVYGWTSSTTWVLNTTASNPSGNNGAFYTTEDPDLGANHLRFGTSATTNGPTTVRMEGKNFPAITNPENTLNGISRITIDAHTGVAGSLTVSVAGIEPTSYALNYGTPVAGSTATTIPNEFTYYTFYFPFLVIGKIRMSFTNGSTPGFFDIGNFSIIGENLTLSEQTGVFANMLNNTDSCSLSDYDNLKLVYDYLSNREAVSTLSSYSMTLHSGSLNAESLWAIMVARKASNLFTHSVNPETISPTFEGIKFYLLIIGVIGVSVAAYFFTIYRKKRITI